MTTPKKMVTALIAKKFIHKRTFFFFKRKRNQAPPPSLPPNTNQIHFELQHGFEYGFLLII